MLTYLRNLLRYEPAVLAWAVNGGLALLLAFVFHLSKTEQAAVITITTGLASVVTFWKAGPSEVPAILGALTTAVTAAGAFGFHPSAQLLATLAAVGSAVLPWIMRANLTPKATAAHQPEHAVGIVASVEHTAHLLSEEDLERLANRMATKVATIIRPARPGRAAATPR